MSTMNDAQLARLDHARLLHEAIENWHPGRPRRWLAKFGNLHAEAHNPLAEQYRTLRHEAERALGRPHIKSANGLASYSLHLEL